MKKSSQVTYNEDVSHDNPLLANKIESWANLYQFKLQDYNETLSHSTSKKHSYSLRFLNKMKEWPNATIQQQGGPSAQMSTALTCL